MEQALRSGGQTQWLTIREVALKYEISFRTLRFYEQIGMLTPSRLGTARLYQPKDTIRLKLILKGKLLRFSLEEIRKLIDSNFYGDPDVTTIVERLSTDEVVEQISQLEKERNALVNAITELHKALGMQSA